MNITLCEARPLQSRIALILVCSMSRAYKKAKTLVEAHRQQYFERMGREVESKGGACGE